jgi:UDP-N-acetylmuramoylalanine--D-glutamate ligase
MKIAIIGLGKSGVAALKLAKLNGHECIAINQGEPNTWGQLEDVLKYIDLDNCFSQENASEALKQAELIIKSPGVSNEIELLRDIDSNIIISEIEWAFRFLDQTKIIAITGTNGKTTTVTMLGEYMKSQGLNVFVGGNIGTPLCEMVCEQSTFDFTIVELSSFQLENIQSFHAQVAVILNIEVNHGERYKSHHDYVMAKVNIVKNQGKDDLFISQAKDLIIKSMIEGSPVKKKFIDYQKAVEKFKSKLGDKAPKLKGEFNLYNAYISLQILNHLNVDDSDFFNFYANFAGVEFRLEFIRDFGGLKIYNDSKSTNFFATTSALISFSIEEENTLILCGKIRGDEVISDEFKKSLARVNEIVTFGDAKSFVNENLKGIKIIELESLSELKSLIEKGELKGNLIFSPGFPSFDQFESYAHRGREFSSLVLALV